MSILKTPKYKRGQQETVKKEIPGELFVLDVSNMVNINIYYPEAKTLKENEGKKKTKRIEVIFNTITLCIFISFILFIISLFTNFGIHQLESFKWYRKLYLMFLLIQFLSVFNPVGIEDENDSNNIEYKYIGKKALVSIIILIIMCIGYYFWFMH